MQTPSISNLPNLSANQSAAVKSAESGDRPSQFTQMLARQISERDASKLADNSNAAKRQENTVRPSATENATPSNAPDTATSMVKTESSGKAADAKVSDSDTKTDKPIQNDDAAVAAGPADAALSAAAAIMALVANAGQAAAKPVSITETAVPVAADAGTVNAHTDLRDLADRIDAKAALDVATAANDSAANPVTKFGTALQTAAEAKSGIETTTPKSSEALRDAQIDTLRTAQTDLTNPLLQQQQTVATIAPPVGAFPGNGLMPQVGSNGWDQSLGQRMVWMVAGAEQSASLTLNPPDLGPMQVVLHVTNGHADASFFSAQPEVRQALEAALPKLREMLGEAGVTLGQTNVSAGQPQQQDAANQQRSAPRQTTAGPADTGTVTALPARFSSGDGLVDTFA